MHCLLTWNSFLCFTPILLPFPTSSKVFNNSGTCWHLSRMQCSKWFHCNVACKIYFIPQVRRCDETKECNTCTHTYSHPQIHKQLKTNSTFLKLQCPVRQTKLLLSSEYFLPLHHSRASPWESRPYLLRWFQKPFRNLLHIDLWDSYWDDPFVSLSNKPFTVTATDGLSMSHRWFPQDIDWKMYFDNSMFQWHSNSVQYSRQGCFGQRNYWIKMALKTSWFKVTSF